MLIQINTDVHTLRYSILQISQVKTDVIFIFEGIAHVGSFFSRNTNGEIRANLFIFFP